MCRDENLDVEMSVEHLAYVIYTSGSTGQPKGAMNPHRAVANRLLWGQEAFQLRHVGQRAPENTGQLRRVGLGALLAVDCGCAAGAGAAGGHKDNAYLSRLIRSEHITTIHFVPPMLDVFLDEPDVTQCTSLRYVITSGEALRPEVQAKFFDRLGADLFNLYGPTETAVEVTSWRCERGATPETVPIGRPIANARMHILDRAIARRCRSGVPGELHIAGVPVGRGYWKRPDLTARAFVPDPFVDRPGARMYKSGDLARYLPDGNIDFLGRLDHQVKIRGLPNRAGGDRSGAARAPGRRAMSRRGARDIGSRPTPDRVRRLSRRRTGVGGRLARLRAVDAAAGADPRCIRDARRIAFEPERQSGPARAPVAASRFGTRAASSRRATRPSANWQRSGRNCSGSPRSAPWTTSSIWAAIRWPPFASSITSPYVSAQGCRRRPCSRRRPSNSWRLRSGRAVRPTTRRWCPFSPSDRRRRSFACTDWGAACSGSAI